MRSRVAGRIGVPADRLFASEENANILVTKITISGDDSHRRAFSSLLLLRVG